MKECAKCLAVFPSLAAFIIGLFPTQVAPAGSPTNQTVSAVITAAGRSDDSPVLTPNDIQVSQEEKQLPVTDVTLLQQVKPRPDVTILFDDSLKASLGPQLTDLADFVRSLASDTRVAVAYIRNSTFTMGQDLTFDRESAIKALRSPLGTPGEFPSPYLALKDLITAMRDEENRRAILMISDGLDQFRGSLEVISPDLEPAYHAAQRKGVIIYVIYAPREDQAKWNSTQVSHARGSLTELASETGGETFLLGSSTPDSLKRKLEELPHRWARQLLVTFQVPESMKGSYEHFRFTTQVPGVELLAPNHIYVPAGK
jgi:hypothetical protein